MSLDSLYAQLDEKKKDKDKLANLNTKLSLLKNHAVSLCNILKEASSSIEKAGSINGKPFDNGKTEEYAKDFETTNAKIDQAIYAVKSDMRILDYDIANIQAEIKAEQARLAELSNRQSPNNSNNNGKNTVKKTPNNSRRGGTQHIQIN